jgi:hypothetical protein
VEEEGILLCILVRIRQSLRCKIPHNQINDIKTNDIHQPEILISIESIKDMYVEE